MPEVVESEVSQAQAPNQLGKIRGYAVSAVRRAVGFGIDQVVFIIACAAVSRQTPLTLLKFQLPFKVLSCHIGNGEHTLSRTVCPFAFHGRHLANFRRSRRQLKRKLFHYREASILQIHIALSQTQYFAHTHAVHACQHDNHFPFGSGEQSKQLLHLGDGVWIRRFPLFSELGQNIPGWIVVDVAVFPRRL